MRKNQKPQRLSNLAMGMVQFLVLAGPVTAQIPCGYEVQIIQGPFCEPFGFPPTIAKGVSETGEVVGLYNSCVVGPSRAFRWTEETGFVTLQVPDGFTSASAQDIDSATGWIVGAMTPQGQNVSTAALWIDGKAIDLGTLPGGNYSHAFAVANGWIVGKWGNNINGDPAIGAFLYQNGKMLNIHADLGMPNSWAWDVNAAGQVTGWMGCAPQIDARAFIWDAGRVNELPPIPGGLTSEGRAITSDSSTIVGVGRWIDPDTEMIFGRAFSYANGEMINLGTLPGHLASSASDISDQGIVIGSLAGGAASGFIWYQGMMVDLNSLIPSESGVEISGGSAINSQGQIAATGHDAKGDVVGLLLTPVEPPLGDIDMDCAVGVKDLLILLGRWGPCGDCDDCSADLDANCIVGVNDLLLLLGNWG